MSERILGNQRYTTRRDVASGSNTNLWWWPQRSRIELASKPEYQDIGLQGSFVGDGHVKTYEMSDGSLVVPDSVDANELGFWLTMRHGLPVTANPASGVYTHTWDIDPLVRPVPVLAECQVGAIDDVVSEQYRQVCLRSLSLNATKRDCNLSGSAFGQAVVEAGTAITGGISHVQTIAITGSPTGGTYTLKYKGASTTLAYNAATSAVQTALRALATIGAGNVDVAGTASNYTVTGAGALAGVEMNAIEVSHAFTGGTSPAITCTQTTLGGWQTFNKAPFIGGHLACYVAAAYADLGSNKLADLHGFTLDIGDGFDPHDKMDVSSGLTYTGVVPKPFPVGAMITIQANTFGQTIAGYARSLANKFMRMSLTSDQIIASATPYSLQVDLYGQFKDNGDREAAGQVAARQFAFNAVRDASTGRVGRIVLTNAVASYAI